MLKVNKHVRGVFMGTELESGRVAKLVEDVLYESPSGIIRLSAGDMVTVGRISEVTNGFFTKETFEPKGYDTSKEEHVFIRDFEYELIDMKNLRLFIVSIPYEKAIYETAWKVAVVATSPEDALKIVQANTVGFSDDIVTIEEKPLYQEGVILVAEK